LSSIVVPRREPNPERLGHEQAAQRERDEQKRVARERRAELLRELLAEDVTSYPAKRSPAS
jgi:hypothetical protein